MSDRIKDNGSANAPSPREPETYDHAGIRALAKALGLKMSALTVLGRDPFTADGTGGNSESDGRIAGAEWFAEEVYKRLDITPEAHMRRIYYKLMSQDLPILMLNGEVYINTESCEGVLERCSLDARYLKLVPPFVDRRNPEPAIFASWRAGTDPGGGDRALLRQRSR